MEVKKTLFYDKNERKTMTVKEMCLEYGIGENKGYELVHTPGFPMIRLGRNILIIRSAVDSWLSSQIGKQL